VRGVGKEVPVSFACEGAALVGMLHLPADAPSIGVVIVVGGPQYRVGSHRQFVLLARDLASRSCAVLRFDCRGMGDSKGTFTGFEHIEPDVAAAVEFMEHQVPSIKQIALWGLCDATLAICAYARRNSRVAGVVLLNPWVRSEVTQARAQLKHYYVQRLIGGRVVRRILSGELNPLRSGHELIRNIVCAVRRQRGAKGEPATSVPLAERMGEALRLYRGRILVITSGRDLTAKEFEDVTQGSKLWRRLYAEARVTRQTLPDADHTFSRRVWRDQVADWTSQWIESWKGL